MTIVAKGPGFVACSFTDESVRVARPGKRTVYFDFSEMFGPLFTDSKGESLSCQPEPPSYHWQAFEQWHRARLADKAGVAPLTK